MKKIIVLIILFLPALASGKKINVDLDLCNFSIDSVTTRTEIYYSYPDTTYTFVQIENGYQGNLLFMLTVEGENVNDTIKWSIPQIVNQPPESYRLDMTGQKNLVYPTGEYVYNLTIRDLYDSTTFANIGLKNSQTKCFDDNICLSGMQLAKVIEEKGKENFSWNDSFLKNGLYVVPNPSLLFHGKLEFVFVYYEILNNTEEDIQCKIRTSILDFRKVLQFSIPEEVTIQNDRMVKQIAIPIHDLPTGVYYLKTELDYSKDQKPDHQERIKKLYLINPEVEQQEIKYLASDILFERSEFATYSKERLESEFEKAKLIAIGDEIDIFENLTEHKAKQKFLFDYWRKRDSDTNTVYNDQLLLFRKRIEYANRNFSYGLNYEGWRTDRGKIYAKYGEPTQRDTHVKDKGKRAYEVWYYDLYEGGIQFVFVDFTDMNNLELVHSTSMYYVKNVNWFQDYVDTEHNDTGEYDENGFRQMFR